ncbi:MAG: HAD family hydrolase [Planctomycetes bacterium]|nr:HAD family hydrolase [Planctomycetota bacterium]
MTLDLWETLIHEDADTEAARRGYRVSEIARVARANHLELSAEALEQAHQAIFARLDPFWSANLDLSILEQTKMFIETAAGSPIDGRLSGQALLEASRVYGEAALKFPPKPAQGANAVLAAVRASGLRLALLCNTHRTPGKVLREILSQFDMKPFFDVLCFSDELRLRKPAAEFFTRALARLNVPPETAVHIGSNPDTDLVGARSAGMRTVFVRPSKAAEAAAGLADFTIGAIADLPEILGQLMAPPSSGQKFSTSTTPQTPSFGKETTHL